MILYRNIIQLRKDPRIV
jgi:hypothetical protein